MLDIAVLWIVFKSVFTLGLQAAAAGSEWIDQTVITRKN